MAKVIFHNIKVIKIIEEYSDKNIMTKRTAPNSKLNALTSSLSLSAMSKQARIVSTITSINSTISKSGFIKKFKLFLCLLLIRYIRKKNSVVILISKQVVCIIMRIILSIVYLLKETSAARIVA